MKSNESSAKGSNPEKSFNFCETCWHFFLALILFAALAFLFFFMKIGANKVKILAPDSEIEKSSGDERKYRAIRLANSLEVILVTDERIQNSAVSLTIGAGSFQDPEDASGIAHLTEHLVYTGTELDEVLNKNFGFSNSFTEEEKTNFYFELYTEGFDKVLSAFSSILNSPVITEERIRSIIEVIKSEFLRTKGMDQWKERRLIKDLANPNHPYSKLTLGDYEKLSKMDINYLQHLVNTFYNKNYIPSNMKLVLISSMNLNSLESLANYHFSDIRKDYTEMLKIMSAEVKMEKMEEKIKIKNNLKKFQNLPYTSAELSRLIWYQNKSASVKEGNKDSYSTTPTLDFIFITEEIISKEKIQTKPAEYITYLLKYQGEGSLIDTLRKNNLALNADIGVIASFKTFSIYAISVSLTSNGVKNTYTIMNLTFAYLNKLRTGGDKFINDAYYNEIKTISELNFKFLMKEDPDFSDSRNKKLNSKMSDYITSLSMYMFDYEPVQAIKNEFFMGKFNSTVISDFASSLVPGNALTILGSNSIPKKYIENPTYQKDNFYDFNYAESKMSEELREKLLNASNEGLVIRPVGNMFIPQDKDFVSSAKTQKSEKSENSYDKKNNTVTNNSSEEDSSNFDKFLQIFRIDNNNNNSSTTHPELNNIEKEEIKPKLVVNAERIKIWYRLDRTFSAPRVNIYLNLISKSLRGNKAKYLYFTIFNEYLQSYVDKYLSDAVDAGNFIKLDLNENGFIIKISAFTDISDKILGKIVNFIFDSSDLTGMSNKLPKERYSEFMSISLIKLGKMNILSQSLYEDIFIKIIKKGVEINQDDLVEDKYPYSEFINEINTKEEFYVNSLFYGNIPSDKFKALKKLFKPYFTNLNSSSSQNELEEFKLIDKLHSHNDIDNSIIYKTTQNNDDITSYTANYYQIGSRTVKSMVLSDLIELVWGNLFYYQIETVKKVGSILSAQKQVKDNIIYLVFAVESESPSDPDFINKELDQVLSLLFERIEKMEESKLKLYKEVLLKRYKANYSNLNEKSSASWSEVYQDSLDFDFKRTMLSELDDITTEDLNDFFAKNFIGQPRKLSIRIYPKKITSTLNSKEDYGVLNNKLKSLIYTQNTDFLAQAKIVHKRITQ